MRITAKLTWALVAGLCVSGCTWPDKTDPTVEKKIIEGDPNVAKVVAGNNAFGFELYARLKSQPGNLFLSPYSISSAVAMTYAGARGNTEAQMARVMNFDLGQDSLHPAFATVISHVNSRGNQSCELAVANALWAQKGYEFRKEYFDLLAKGYQSRPENVDFRAATEDARRTINAWVEKHTKDKIKDLMKPGTIDTMTRLVLTDAIYFKGKWARQFEKRQTSNGPFTVADGQKTDVPLMHQNEDFNYVEVEGSQVLELPYKGDALSMVIFLPRQVDGLAGLEAKLTAQNAATWMGQMHQQGVNVYLPKFKMQSEFDLKDNLSTMGMTDAFDQNKADFSGMSDKQLFIGAAVHKAFVDVNEEGTEAAAASGWGVMGLSAKPKSLPFRADHPFFFIIRDRITGSILFMGRVMDPRNGDAK